jgi:hypothetical protein
MTCKRRSFIIGSHLGIVAIVVILRSDPGPKHIEEALPGGGAGVDRLFSCA